MLLILGKYVSGLMGTSNDFKILMFTDMFLF